MFLATTLSSLATTLSKVVASLATILFVLRRALHLIAEWMALYWKYGGRRPKTKHISSQNIVVFEMTAQWLTSLTSKDSDEFVSARNETRRCDNVFY